MDFPGLDSFLEGKPTKRQSPAFLTAGTPVGRLLTAFNRPANQWAYNHPIYTHDPVYGWFALDPKILSHGPNLGRYGDPSFFNANSSGVPNAAMELSVLLVMVLRKWP